VKSVGAGLSTRSRLRLALPLLGLVAAGSTLLADKTYEEHRVRVALPHRSVTLTCAKPVAPRGAAFLVLFASGDGGLHFTSKTVYKHLAERGDYVAAFSSDEALKTAKQAGKGITVAEFTDDIAALMREGRRALGLPATTPVVVTGLSRGASMVVLAGAQPSLQPDLAGGVAIALTLESDYGKAQPPRPGEAAMPIDARGRILIYPQIEKMGAVRLAVIQSTRDSYVPSAESRRLMGPDTSTRRLYEVDASNHSFGGAKDTMLANLDAALEWIAAGVQGRLARPRT
jgi:hypothetical protein